MIGHGVFSIADKAVVQPTKQIDQCGVLARRPDCFVELAIRGRKSLRVISRGLQRDAASYQPTFSMAQTGLIADCQDVMQ